MAADLVTVAPREIHDLVYRACRVGGCDSGAADRVARSVTFGEIHLGESLGVFVAAYRQGDLNVSPFVTAPQVVERSEVAARSGTGGTVSFGSAVPLVTVAEVLWQAAGRGVSTLNVDWARTAGSPVEALELVVGATESAVPDRFATRADEAYRSGVSIGRSDYDDLVRAASRFLVAEETLDAIAT